MKPLSLILIFVACLLIALGRVQIRRARRAPSGSPFRQRLVGWAFSFLGLLLMIVGVVIWS